MKMTFGDWIRSSYIPREGELCIATDTSDIRIGNGINRWSELRGDINTDVLVTAHNNDSFAHTDIREQIGQLSSEVDEITNGVLGGDTTYTNQIQSSISSDGTEYVGENGEDGYKVGYRINSSGNEDAEDGANCTGFIPVKLNDVVRFKNIAFSPTGGSGTHQIMCYNENFGNINGVTEKNFTDMQYLIRPYEVDETTGYLKSFTVSNWGAGYSYIRVVSTTLDANSIITVNEEITVASTIKERVSALETTVTKLDARVTTLESAEEASNGIPDYVIAEAESVIDRVISAQGNRTFTFAAITDLHYGNGSYTDGIKHACQAMKYIDERIKLDAVAVLGDYTDGYPASTYDDSIADFKAINAMLSGVRFAPNLRIRGNHDFDAIDSPLNHRYIYAYSDGVVWGDRIGGYFYKDFEDCKLRVICLNTVEGGDGVICSTEQYNWFINSLDLTDKENAEEWHILALSHHPMDWWTDPYVFAYVIDAYQKGTSWTNGIITCDFAEKNKATFVGNIHGHIHNFKTDYLRFGNPTQNTDNKSSVLRMGTPNACYDRDNQYNDASYNGVWVEDTTYSKTKNTADDTAFCVYCVDLDTCTIKAISYGAGYDRDVNYTSGAVVTMYTVSNKLTNVSNSNNNTSIVGGEAYTATLATTNGEDFASVVVTMGGVDVTSSVYADGVISIERVTGNVVITAVAKEAEVVVNLIDTVGFEDNMRLSSSAGTTKKQDGNVTTGFIELGNVGDVYRTSGVDFSSDGSGFNIICFYNSSQAFTTHSAYMGGKGSSQSAQDVAIEVDGVGNLTLTLTSSFTRTGDYIKITGYGLGANLFVTKNQEIS